MGTTERPFRLLMASVGIVAALFVGAALLLGMGRMPGGPSKRDGASVAASQRRPLVEAAIRAKTNDPASLTIEKVLFGPRGIDPNGSGHVHQYVRVSYRERNALGAMVYVERVFRIVDDRRLVWLDHDEQFLFGHSSSEWVPDPAGPPR